MREQHDSGDTPDRTHGGSPARPRRAEIQGLRTVAAALVGVYHIWFDRVSGGVDVFFVVSGFLITTSLVGSLRGDGSIRYGAYLSRIGRRILPAAYVVLVISAVLTIALISRVYWEETFREIRAAALYIANWEFAASSVDYLAIDEFQSPVLQFWALSVQGQFYLVWPVVMLAAFTLARRTGLQPRAAAIGVIGTVVMASFGYAIVRVGQNQVSSYYDSIARIWEFGLGALVALTVTTFVMSVPNARILSAVGLAMILSTGIVLDVSGSFPGWPALIPTVGTVLVLVSGTCSQPVGGLRVLRSRPIVALGDISYAFFLWQWTLLSFTKIHLGLDRFTFLQGLGVMAAALAAAFITHHLVERPFLRRRDSAPARPSLVEGIGVLAVVASITITGILSSPRDTLSTAEVLGSGRLPDVLGRVIDDQAQRPSWQPPPIPVADDLFTPGDGPLVPDPATARRDRPIVYEDGCHQNQQESEAIVCIYGAPGGTRVALVGGSHVAQWQPAFDLLGQRHGWEIWSITRSACRFGRSPDASDACLDWVDNSRDLLLEERPAYVVVLGTTGSSSDERIVDGASSLWNKLADAGVELIALRDNPWFRINPPECVLEHGIDSPECARDRSEALAPENPLLEHPSLTDLSLVIDLTPWFCTSDVCPVVAGNVLMYRDSHHLTVPYVLSLAPVLEHMLVPTLGTTELSTD